MNLLVKSIKIADPKSEFNSKTCDIRIEKGSITAIAEHLTANKNEQVFEAAGSILSPGFMDLNCMIGDPGFETKEDLKTGTAAAKAGGFTAVAVQPSTKPVIHSKSEVEYLLNKAKGNLVDIYPLGAISQNLEGKELAEMYDMKTAGAVAFSEGNKTLTDDGFMSRALQYALGFDGLLITFPENKAISTKAHVNESENTILLGMKGIPALAEEMQISRDLFLAQYHGAPVHISNISTAGAVTMIKKAKKDGIKVTCDVAAHQLIFTDDLLSGFDSNYKVKPPLRSKADVKALLAGLKDGTIDAISTQHRPHEIEFKDVEFEIAAYGIIALQTALPLLLQAGLSPELIVQKMALNPRKLLKLETPVIKVGSKANFVVYNPEQKWQYTSQNNYSKSANSPLLNKELTGKVQLVYNNSQYQSYE
ncbi:dihydroorotase [Pedobacter montanisoli]|uniref:Dihydroorotase n=1 Tax=Pedobacter montanisoli TaxID=2923277 RepID=A0ABS9ZZU0_9SPHI|nr:dihydroorotase [Pedobacter montanisoli]MCJ0743833.1 dihydroorotase [Pedobacter montanisoli]